MTIEYILTNENRLTQHKYKNLRWLRAYKQQHKEIENTIGWELDNFEYRYIYYPFDQLLILQMDDLYRQVNSMEVFRNITKVEFGNRKLEGLT